MNISNWIALGSSIGAMIAASVALFTLLELSRQRRSTYKPDLCLLRNAFAVKWGAFPSSAPIPPDWTPRRPPQHASAHIPSIPLVNVGFGAAKKAKAKWRFDSDSMMKEVNHLAQKTFQAFYFVENDSMLTVKADGKTVYGASKADTWEFEYVLPVSVEASGREVSLPASYVALVSAYLFLCVKDSRIFTDIKVPDIELELSYSDIGKGQHHSMHRLQCNILMATYRSEKAEEFSPEFEFEYVEVAQSG